MDPQHDFYRFKASNSSTSVASNWRSSNGSGEGIAARKELESRAILTRFSSFLQVSRRCPGIFRANFDGFSMI